MSVELTGAELTRYSRHLSLPEVGLEGQKRLRAARVLCVGAGGLGSPLALYLAAAGVGTLGLVDFDRVDSTNLQRQILHGESDIGRPKVDSARDALREINPHVEVITFHEKFTSANAREIAREFDILVDGTDNFPARYLTCDTAVLLGKPYVYGSIFRFEGQASVFWAERGPCYRCLYPEPPPPGTVPSCAEGGVLGVLPGIIGCIQATETVKIILGIGTPLVGRLLLFNALSLRFQEIKLRKDPHCPLCGPDPILTELSDYDAFCGVCGEDIPTPKGKSAEMEEITPTELKARMDRGDVFTLVDVREPYEVEIARIPGAILIPLGDIPSRRDELNPSDEIILHCRSGKRSANALLYLQSQGFTNLKNLKGGVLAWSDEVDPTVPKY